MKKPKAKFGGAALLLIALIGGPFAVVPHGWAAEPAETLRDARTKYRVGQYDEAVRLVTKVIEGNEKSFEALRLRAAAYEELGRLKQAITDLDRCIELRPDEPAAHHQEGHDDTQQAGDGCGDRREGDGIGHGLRADTLAASEEVAEDVLEVI